MKILFVYQKLMPFVERDLRILEGSHTVRELKFSGRTGLVINLIIDLCNLWRGICWADLTFCWFGKLHAFFAVIISRVKGKPSIVVSGGDEVAKVPEIKYGLFTHPIKQLFPLYTFGLTDMILSVSEANRRETLVNAKARPHKVRLIYHGFDGNEFCLIPDVIRQQLVLTVGRITLETLEKKGLRLFVQAAQYMPDIPFAIVGWEEAKAGALLRKISPRNVTFYGPMLGKELVAMYNRAKVYAQLSYGESFGCAIAEAMLCGCAPVLTRGRAIEEVGGDVAFYVNSRDPFEVVRVIRKALNADLGQSGRRRILMNFSLDTRQELLLKAVQEIKEKQNK